MLRFLAFVVFSAISWLISLAPSRGPPAGVLVLRLDAIGDFFIWMRSGLWQVAEYARSLGSPVVLLARREWAELAASAGVADEVLAIDVDRFCRDLRYRIRWLWELRRRGFHYAIAPRAAREIWLEDWIVLAVHAPLSIGSEGLDVNLPHPYKTITDRWYARRLPTVPLWIHESVRNARLTRELTGREAFGEAWKVKHLAPLKFSLEGRYFVIAPGAAAPGRRWPADRFAAVARRILETASFRCVLVGTHNDAEACKVIASKLPPERVIDLSGRTRVSEMVAIIGAAQLLLGSESGPCHVAAALGVPSVVTLGGGHFGWFLPYPSDWCTTPPLPLFEKMDCFNCNWHCMFDVAPRQPYPCIERVGADRVVAAIRQIGLANDGSARTG